MWKPTGGDATIFNGRPWKTADLKSPDLSQNQISSITCDKMVHCMEPFYFIKGQNEFVCTYTQIRLFLLTLNFLNELLQYDKYFLNLIDILYKYLTRRLQHTLIKLIIPIPIVGTNRILLTGFLNIQGSQTF